jgi:hypothetical protein
VIIEEIDRDRHGIIGLTAEAPFTSTDARRLGVADLQAVV